jgi:hypothetical protein
MKQLMYSGTVGLLSLQPRIHGLALEGEDRERALVDAAERLAADEALQALDPDRELAVGDAPLASEAALEQVLGEGVLGAVDVGQR